MADQKRIRIKPYLVVLVDYNKPKTPKPVEVDGQTTFMVLVREDVSDVEAFVGMQAGAICAKADVDPVNVEPFIAPFAPTR